MLITNYVVLGPVENMCFMLHAMAGGDGAVVPDEFIQNLLTTLLHIGLPDFNMGPCLYQDNCKPNLLR